jgi:hypothetical protein
MVLTNDRLLILERFGGTESQELASEVLRLRKVVDELKFLRDSGYDGPFMGEAIEPLMLAFHAWERETLESAPPIPRPDPTTKPCDFCGSGSLPLLTSRSKVLARHGPVDWYAKCLRDDEEWCFGPVRWYGQHAGWVCDDHARGLRLAGPSPCPNCREFDARPFQVVGRCIRTKEELQALPVGTKLACEEDPSADCDLCHSRFDAFFTKIASPEDWSHMSARWKRDDGHIFSEISLASNCLGRLYIVIEEPA